MVVVDFVNAAVITAFFSSIVFLVGYSIVAPWWRHPVGRAVASLDVGLILALIPSNLRLLFKINLQHVWFAWYYGCSLFLVAAITLWRLFIIISVQRTALRQEFGADD